MSFDSPCILNDRFRKYDELQENQTEMKFFGLVVCRGIYSVTNSLGLSRKSGHIFYSTLEGTAGDVTFQVLSRQTRHQEWESFS